MAGLVVHCLALQALYHFAIFDETELATDCTFPIRLFDRRFSFRTCFDDRGLALIVVCQELVIKIIKSDYNQGCACAG